MKHILLLICFALSVPTLAVPRTNISVARVLKHAGLPKKIELSPLLSGEIERIIAAAQFSEIGESLLRAGNLQEIIWQLQEMGAEQQSRELTLLLQATLENAEIVDVKSIGIGRSGAELVTFANGVRGVFKTTSDDEDEFIREIMVYHFDRLIGTNVFPLTTLRTIDGNEGSIQLFIENSMSAFDIVEERLEMMGERRHVYDQDEIEDIIEPESPNVKTLKLLTLNSDHINPQNYLFPHVGRIVAIDGSRAFTGEDDAVKKVAKHLRAQPDAFNLDPTFVSQLELVLSSTFTKVDDVLLSLLPVKEIEDLLAVPYRDEFEKFTNILSSRHLKEFKQLGLLKRTVDEYVAIAPTIEPRLPEHLLTALQAGDLYTAQAALDKGVSGDIALENALASHNVRAAEWLLAQGYYLHNSKRLDYHLESALESAIESKKWQFVDWVLLEKKLYDFYDVKKLRNFEDYVSIAWERENFSSILELASRHIPSDTFIKAALDKALAKGYFAKSMLILNRAMRDDISKYVDQSNIGEYILTIAMAALVAEKHDITVKLVNIAKKRLGDGADLLGNSYFNDNIDYRYSNFDGKYRYRYSSIEELKYLVEWVMDNGFYTDDSFYSILDKNKNEIDLLRFMLRKHFATRNTVDITVKLLNNDKYNVVGYWIEASTAQTRSRILLHTAKTVEYYENYMDITKNLSWKDNLNAFKYSLREKEFTAASRMFDRGIDNYGYSHKIADYLLDTLEKNEVESWEYMRWLLENEDWSMLAIIRYALKRKNFDIVNWILANIDAREQKYIGEEIAENWDEEIYGETIVLKSSLQSFTETDKQKYPLLFNFLSEYAM